MSYEMISLAIIVLFILILFVIKLITPQIVRRELFFGVRIPTALLDDKRLLDFKKTYIKNYLSVCGFYTLSFCIVLIKIPNNAVLLTGIVIFFLLSAWLYYLTHRRVMEFKQANQVQILNRKQVVMVDTSFRNDQNKRILPPGLWFLIPLIIICLNLVTGYLVYDELPIIVPTHWNIQGEVDGGVFKTWGLVFFFPVVQIFITGFMFLLYRVGGWSKLQISTVNPEDSRERNRVFRFRWGANIIFLNILILLAISLLNLFVLQIVPINIVVLLFVQPLLIIFILLDILFMAVWSGQGGSRLNIQPGSSYIDNDSTLDDDEYWKGGLIYYNPRDPALFVEKRFGIAWGLNYGNINAYILIIFIVGALFLLGYLTELMLFY
jgi:uncharacterized membrane protein